MTQIGNWAQNKGSERSREIAKITAILGDKSKIVNVSPFQYFKVPHERLNTVVGVEMDISSTRKERIDKLLSKEQNKGLELWLKK